MAETLETRTLELELRVEGEEQEPRLVGYAVKWGERSQPLPFIERFLPGAFTKALESGRDVLALVDHDRSKVLGRRSNGTLELREDEVGLRVTIRPNLETSYGRDIVAAVRRGDVAGMSVGFIARRERWVPDGEAGQVREVLEADLREVSVASMPAYTGTSVQTRKELVEVEERVERQEQAAVATAAATATAVEERNDDGKKEQRTAPRLEVALATPVSEQRSAFESFLRGEPFDTRALKLSPATAGGYLAPESFVAELIRKLNEASVMRRIADVRGPIEAASVRFPVLTKSVEAKWTPEATAITPSDPTFAQVEFTPHKLAAMTLVSNELLADAAVNVEALLAELFGEEFAAVEDAAFFTGDGDGKPLGILADTEDGVSIIPTVDAKGSTIGADDVINTYTALPPQYRANAVWVMHPKTEAILRTLKDEQGQYLLIAGLAGPTPTTLLGRPVYITSNMPEPAAGAKVLLFGDIRRAYRIVDRRGVDVQRSTDRYFEQDLTAFRAIKRVDGKVILPEAARCLVLADE